MMPDDEAVRGMRETRTESAAKTLAYMLREIERVLAGQAKRYGLRDHCGDLRPVVEFFEAPALIALAAALRRLATTRDLASARNLRSRLDVRNAADQILAGNLIPFTPDSIVGFVRREATLGYPGRYNLACYYAEGPTPDFDAAFRQLELALETGGAQLARWAMADNSFESLRESKLEKFNELVNHYLPPRLRGGQATSNASESSTSRDTSINPD